MKNIYLNIPLSQTEISGLVLATVTRTEGSTPQKPGSSAIFSRSGLVMGTVGGGVMEGKVERLAMKSVLSKTCDLRTFTLDKLTSGGEEALCGGRITILLDSDLEKHSHLFSAIKSSFADGIPGVLVTSCSETGKSEAGIKRYWATSDTLSSVPGEIAEKAGSQIDTMLKTLKHGDFVDLELSKRGEKPYSHIFLELLKPSPKLIIAGAGHIGKALSVLGQMLDFDVTVIDDRPEFANSVNLPAADKIISRDIGKTIGEIEKGRETFIVIVTRGHGDDANALRSCITSDAGYIGMIGSRNKVALMKEEFISKGWATNEQWEKIFTPIGMNIGSVTVEEIAVSIAAQLIQVRNKMN
jgi:xanthine dehydrogenase accessory factor